MLAKIAPAAFALSIAGLAAADTVDMKFVSTGEGRNVKITIGGSSQNVFAGQLVHEFSNGTGAAASLLGQIITFCTDLHEHVTSTKKTYDLVSVADVPNPTGMGLDRAGAVDDLYAFAAGSQFGGNDDLAAAFQIAVWEIANDFDASVGRSSLDVTSGNFKARKTDGSALSSSIQGLLADLFDSVGDPGDLGVRTTSVWALRNDGAQDQLVEMIVIPTPMAGGL
ncbi:MAG: hypothetical protein VYC34_03665, partial [Planctomycetota bacterium]|nr:hypothetical protein [Planctomycetota bacterium]